MARHFTFVVIHWFCAVLLIYFLSSSAVIYKQNLGEILVEKFFMELSLIIQIHEMHLLA